MMAHARDPRERPYWLDDPRNVDRLVRGFYVVCALLLLLGAREKCDQVRRLFGVAGIARHGQMPAAERAG